MSKKLAIHFGTSGWRAIIGKEFTFENVRRVACAIAKYIKDQKLQHKGVVIGYDTRFLSEEFAEICAEILAKCEIKVFLVNRDTPTPVISCQILKKKAAGAINITASHNPSNYNGIKFSPFYGGPAPVSVTKEIEKNIANGSVCSGTKETKIQIFDPRPDYLKDIKRLINFQAIRKSHLKIGIDLLYGTGRGYLDQLLIEAGCKIKVLHAQLNHLFGGMPPEPARKQLKELSGLVKSKRMHLGLAIDGDADRFGIIDRDGSYVGANEVISLLTHHLIQTRPKMKTVARTLATTHMIDALAKNAGLELIETPVGFKYIGQEISKGNCLIGGEESGGLSIADHVPEKDGILACLLIAELVAVKGKSLRVILKDLYKQVGPFFSSREDFHLSEEEKIRFVRRMKPFTKKTTLLGKKIAKCFSRDGFKFIFIDGSWIMFRASGTESVVRCYCEASTKSQVNSLLRRGRRLILAD